MLSARPRAPTHRRENGLAWYWLVWLQSVSGIFMFPPGNDVWFMHLIYWKGGHGGDYMTPLSMGFLGNDIYFEYYNELMLWIWKAIFLTFIETLTKKAKDGAPPEGVGGSNRRLFNYPTNILDPRSWLATIRYEDHTRCPRYANLWAHPYSVVGMYLYMRYFVASPQYNTDDGILRWMVLNSICVIFFCYTFVFHLLPGFEWNVFKKMKENMLAAKKLMSAAVFKSRMKVVTGYFIGMRFILLSPVFAATFLCAAPA